ncbi:MAG: cytochrome c biogenesis protein CcsA [Mariprofundaceae bacterium]|nr:cytochrome c biogenesis protein CcsA [Mariprofundaceae bacterium]
MNASFLFPLAGIFTLISAYLIWQKTYQKDHISPSRTEAVLMTLQSISAICTALGIVLLHPIEAQKIHFSLIEATASATLLVQLMYLFGLFRHGIQGLGLLLLPVIAVPLLVAPFLPVDRTTQPIILTSSILETGHLLVSMIAYAVLTMTAFHAVMLLLLDQALKRKKMHPVIQAMPALMSLETLMMSLLRWSVWLLLLAILTGLVWQWVDFSNFALLNHKVLLALMSFALLSWLIQQQHKGVWHARRTSQLILIAYVLMLLAYFGVHLINAWVG